MADAAPITSAGTNAAATSWPAPLACRLQGPTPFRRFEVVFLGPLEMYLPRKPPDTSRVGGTAPHLDDAEILLALELAWREPTDDLIACEAGVRNLEGKIYRRAALKGVGQMFYFSERLEALGFVPELERDEQPGSGFDVIFRPMGASPSPEVPAATQPKKRTTPVFFTRFQLFKRLQGQH